MESVLPLCCFRFTEGLIGIHTRIIIQFRINPDSSNQLLHQGVVLHKLFAEQVYPCLQFPLALHYPIHYSRLTILSTV